MVTPSGLAAYNQTWKDITEYCVNKHYDIYNIIKVTFPLRYSWYTIVHKW